MSARKPTDPVTLRNEPAFGQLPRLGAPGLELLNASGSILATQARRTSVTRVTDSRSRKCGPSGLTRAENDGVDYDLSLRAAEPPVIDAHRVRDLVKPWILLTGSLVGGLPFSSRLREWRSSC